MADKRKIGKSGLTVNPVGLGCIGFSHAYGAPHVVIATKFGVAHGSNGLIMDSRPETIRKSVEGSLKRLGVDVIDLYYQHRIDPNIEPETVAEVMNELIKEGKIRYWGISETTEDYLIHRGPE